MYRNILVPTDGSRGSATAVGHAIDLASQYDATVHALHVVEDSGIAAFGRSEIQRDLRERGERLVEAVRDRAGNRDVDCETAVVSGSPPERIVQYASENDVDLVVVGTHGRTGVRRYLLGSVAERVVRTAPVPVLTLSPGVTPVADADDAIETARETLESAGYDEITFEGSPSRQRDTWVVRAKADDDDCNVHVSSDGHARIAHLSGE